ncbi:N-acetyltransferase family protein [Acidipropionibacterium jensenii]|uniref:GNAT family N-acetyltransferase n=1 Tax=Acidipropionibacterium jensenii TaxID=1749 RepID=UPI00110B7251|nr:GNAT family N-acetyltransferase [Acidipropionibacterium jensenii]QCV88705.1 N-acetyltransferase family protein [Acidipropionibacterium jensenii]
MSSQSRSVSRSGAEIRVVDAGPEHLATITVIYNEAVRNTTAVWNSQVVTQEERRAWWQDHQRSGYPVLVAVSPGPDGEQVLGYASLSGWRASFTGYRLTAEDSIYVAAEHRGRGAGRALATALIERARSLGLHVIVAAIEAGNTASIRLHRSLGFERVALMRQVGVKFGSWLDLALMQLTLDSRSLPPGRS